MVTTHLHHPVLPPLLPLSVTTTTPTTTTITRWCNPVRPIRTAAQRHHRRWWTAPAAGRPFSTVSTCRPSTGTGTSPVWSAPSARWTSRESPVASPGMDSSSAKPTTTGKYYQIERCIIFVSASSFCCGCRHTRIGTYPPVKNYYPLSRALWECLAFSLYRFSLSVYLPCGRLCSGVCSGLSSYLLLLLPFVLKQKTRQVYDDLKSSETLKQGKSSYDSGQRSLVDSTLSSRQCFSPYHSEPEDCLTLSFAFVLVEWLSILHHSLSHLSNRPSTWSHKQAGRQVQARALTLWRLIYGWHERTVWHLPWPTTTTTTMRTRTRSSATDTAAVLAAGNFQRVDSSALNGRRLNSLTGTSLKTVAFWKVCVCVHKHKRTVAKVSKQHSVQFFT